MKKSMKNQKWKMKKRMKKKERQREVLEQGSELLSLHYDEPVAGHGYQWPGEAMAGGPEEDLAGQVGQKGGPKAQSCQYSRPRFLIEGQLHETERSGTQCELLLEGLHSEHDIP